MNNFIIIEVGSINTKTYLYEEKLKDLGTITIEFRNNYKLNKKIMESDLEKLYHERYDLYCNYADIIVKNDQDLELVINKIINEVK